MNSAPTPVLNRLILAVLSLILVCLILLVVKAYRRGDIAQAPAPESVAVAPASEPAASGLVRKPIAFAPRPGADVALVPVTNTVVAPGEDRETVVQPVETTALVVPPPHYTPGGAWPKTGQSARGGAGQGGSAEGVITGTVQLLGTPPPEIPIELGPSCGRLNTNRVTTRHYVVGPNGGLANVFVYIKDAKAALPAGVAPILDQVGCMYEPYIMGVVAGQKFKIKNSDPEMHNVQATPDPESGNSEFNFVQPIKGQVNEKSFLQPEVLVRIKCDVHPWMFAYVGVCAHPYFAVTDKAGNFIISGLPDGKYTVVAYHLKTHGKASEGVVKTIELKGEVRLDISMWAPSRNFN